MTGFGKAEVSLKKLNVNIEVRSLNSKFLDLSLKIPSLFKELELPIRSLIKKELNRGKVELLIHYERLEESKSITLNKEQIQIYHHELTAIQNELKEDSNRLGGPCEPSLFTLPQHPSCLLHLHLFHELKVL